MMLVGSTSGMTTPLLDTGVSLHVSSCAQKSMLRLPEKCLLLHRVETTSTVCTRMIDPLYDRMTPDGDTRYTIPVSGRCLIVPRMMKSNHSEGRIALLESAGLRTQDGGVGEYASKLLPTLEGSQLLCLS